MKTPINNNKKKINWIEMDKIMSLAIQRKWGNKLNEIKGIFSKTKHRKSTISFLKILNLPLAMKEDGSFMTPQETIKKWGDFKTARELEKTTGLPFVMRFTSLIMQD